jgi:CRP/FNR family transcriptional regulator, cyclic AMP receptor protein
LKASNVRSDGKEAILSILEPGNWFGQMSAITGWPYAHDVVALEVAQIVRLPLEAFHSRMQNAAFAKSIAELLAQHTGLLYQMLEEATLYSTRARIARRLMHLARGDATLAAGNRSNIQVSQDTLARRSPFTPAHPPPAPPASATPAFQTPPAAPASNTRTPVQNRNRSP